MKNKKISNIKKRDKDHTRKKSIKKKRNIFCNNLSRAELLLIYIAKTIRECFPDLQNQLNSIPDERVNPFYSMGDVVFSVISMFILKAKSRNSINENRRKEGFATAFAKIFNYNMPHLDTCHNIIKKSILSILERSFFALSR